MAGERLSLLSVVLRRSWGGTGGDQRPFIFQAVLTPSPLHSTSESLWWWLLALLLLFVCLWLLSQYVLSFHLSFSPNWSPLPSLASPHSLSVALSGRLAVSPSALFTQSAYGSPQSSVTPATARGACKGVWLIDHVGITH